MKRASRGSKEQRSVFYGQIDTHFAVKDYQRGGICLRVFAVEETAYEEAQLHNPEGVPIVAFDISYWEYCRHVLGPGTWLTPEARAAVDEREGSLADRSKWYRFEVDWAGARKDGYAFRLYSEEEPRYFQLVTAAVVENDLQVELRAPPTLGRRKIALSSRARAPSPPTAGWRLVSFHVGQGMCSLVTDGHLGVLLDVGAGTPVTRPKYLNHHGFMNDLRSEIGALKTVDLVLSHADADHWRVLAWDQVIRTKIRNIFVPHGAKPIALKDPAVIGKTRQIGDVTFYLSSTSTLHVYRSQPGLSDDNGECLIAVFESAGKRALVAGDYVYGRYGDDAHPTIKTLHDLDFDAVVVPHHGDSASAKMIVPARPDAIAFFSAGTHKKYGHPTLRSRSAHKAAAYIEICNPHCPDIKKVPLI